MYILMSMKSNFLYLFSINLSWLQNLSLHIFTLAYAHAYMSQTRNSSFWCKMTTHYYFNSFQCKNITLLFAFSCDLNPLGTVLNFCWLFTTFSVSQSIQFLKSNNFLCSVYCIKNYVEYTGNVNSIHMYGQSHWSKIGYIHNCNI